MSPLSQLMQSFNLLWSQEKGKSNTWKVEFVTTTPHSEEFDPPPPKKKEGVVEFCDPTLKRVVEFCDCPTDSLAHPAVVKATNRGK